MKSMKFIQLFIIVFVLSIGSITVHAQQDTLKLNREARALVREGNTLYNKQKFADATIAYRKALAKNAKSETASYNYGNALYQDKKYKEAVEQYNLSAKAATDKIGKAEAFHNIGNAMMEQKNYQGAVNAYKNALRNNPSDDETRYNLAVAQKELKKQQQDQKNNKDKNKDKNKDNKDNKDKNKDDKKKQDENKDKKDGGDKDKKDDQNKDQQNPKDQGDKPNQNKNDQQNKQPKPQQGKLTPEQMKQLLESLNNEEKKTQKKMNVKKGKGKKVRQEKDW